MRSRRLVVFDLDGTLVDSRQAITETFNQALEACGHPRVPHDDVAALIGLTLWDMFPRMVQGRLDDDELDGLVDAYVSRYLDVAARYERAFDGIGDALARLRADGRTLAVATSKRTVGAHRSTRDHGLHHHFGLLLGCDSVDRPKPHPAMVQLAMTRLGHGPDATVVVGDTAYDMQMARAAGAAAIGVSWGSHDEDRLREGGAQSVVDDVPSLLRVLGVA